MNQQTHADVTFGPRLKAHRERLGITLDALAASTKVKASLFADLENNNISRWPEGIYGRAWLRDYAAAIGIDPEPVLEEFCRAFDKAHESSRPLVHVPPAAPLPSVTPVAPVAPVASVAAEPAAPAAASEKSPLRLTFAEGYERRDRWSRARVIDAAGIFALVLACGAAIALISGTSFVTAAGIVGLIWYPLASAAFGGASLRGLVRRAAELTHRQPRTADQPKLRIVKRQEPEAEAQGTGESMPLDLPRAAFR